MATSTFCGIPPSPRASAFPSSCAEHLSWFSTLLGFDLGLGADWAGGRAWPPHFSFLFVFPQGSGRKRCCCERFFYPDSLSTLMRAREWLKDCVWAERADCCRVLCFSFFLQRPGVGAGGAFRSTLKTARRLLRHQGGPYSGPRLSCREWLAT